MDERPIITLHPYFYPNVNLPHGGNVGCVNFDIETCEQCGQEVQAPNAFNLHEPEGRLFSFGLIKKKPPTDELGYCEALGKSVCSSCWIPEDARECQCESSCQECNCDPD